MRNNTRKITNLCCFLCLFLFFKLDAQSDTTLVQQLQEEIQSLLKDSSLTTIERLTQLPKYTTPLSKHYEKQDSLLAWGKLYFDIANEDREHHIWYFDSVMQRKWREPKDSTEAYFFLKNARYGGHFHSAYGDIYGAIPLYEHAEQVYERFPITSFDINTLTRKTYANNFTRLGQNAKAISILKKVLADVIVKSDKDIIASTRGNLSLAYMNQFDFELAIQECQTALALEDLSLYRRGFLNFLLAETYLSIENYEQASSYALKAIQQLENCTEDDDYQVPEWLSGAYSTYGKLLQQQGQFVRAERWLEKSIQLSTSNEYSEARDIAKTYNVLAQNYAQQGNFQAAIEIFNTALHTVLGSFAPQNRYGNPTSEDLFEENTIFEALTGKAAALKQLYLENKDLKALESVLICHQLAYETEQLLRQTYQVEAEKIALQVDSRKREGEAIDVLFMLYEATQNADYLNQAFQTAEQSKSTVLLDAIQTNFLQRDISTNDSLFVQQQQFKSYIARYEKMLLTAEQTDAIEAQLLTFKEELDLVNKRIRAKYPNHGRQIKSATNPQYVAQMLGGESDFLLEYFQSADYLYCFVIDANAQLTLERTPLNDTWKADLQQFKQLASNRIAFQNAPQQFYELAHRLYEKVLPKRIKTAIEKDALLQLTIIPDGTLNTCPFDALLTQPHTQGKIPFLIYKAQTNYAFSSNTLRYQQALKSPAKRAMLSMLPIFEGKERGLAPLQYSELAAEQLHYAQSKQLLKSQATRNNFLQQFQDFRVLHFSTHAQADSMSLVPSIEFIDSSLLLPEIYSLPIQADLVVLSACQTALGDARSGEGLMSLARAFAYSGSPSLVATLWKVNNKSTSELVTAFYGHLSAGKSKSKALQQAKLDYLNSNSLAQQSPYYWSGMVFIGADATVELKQAFAWKWLLLGIFSLLVIFIGLRCFKN